MKHNAVKLARFEESLVRKFLGSLSILSVLVTLGIVGILVTESWNFFQHVKVTDFLFGTEWTPLFEPRSFGVLPLVAGTVMITVGAILIALPIGLGTAIFLSELAPAWISGIVKPLLEILAAIPTVVYGFLALTVITPMIQTYLPMTETYNALSAAIVVGVMILPMIASLCDDAIRAVPQASRDAGHALGATPLEVTLHITLPSALSGIVAATILAISRAFGETMAVTLAAGSTPRLTLNPLESIQTLTAYIVQVSSGDTPQGSIEYQSIFAVGLLLMAQSLVFNLLANLLVKKFKREAE